MEKRITKKLVCASLFTLVVSSAGQAATLDFNEVGVNGIVGSTVVNLSNAVLTSSGADMFIGFGYGETNGNGIACGAAADNSCEADWKIDFLADVFDLTFSSFGASFGDTVDVVAYLNGIVVGSVTVTSNLTLDFSPFGAIDQLAFGDSSSSNGIGFGDFSFDNVAPIPLPATLPLLLAGIAGLSLTRRRASRSV